MGKENGGGGGSRTGCHPVTTLEHKPCKSHTEDAQNTSFSTTCGQASLSFIDQKLTLSEQEQYKDIHKKCAHSVHAEKQTEKGAHQTGYFCDWRNLTMEEIEVLNLWRSLSTDLCEIVRALPNLPDPLKRAIIAIVDTAADT